MTNVAAHIRIGGCLHFFPVLDSTNTTAYQLAAGGAAEGEAIIADAQSRGRGRLERVWQSPPGRNLYVSIILKPPLAPSAAPQITPMAGVAVAELLAPYCPGQVAIKWPNDILISGKKACGILTEMKASSGTVDFVILGIGININMNRDDFDPALRDTATSLKIETGAVVDRLSIAGRLFESLEKWYNVLTRDGFPGIRHRFLDYNDMVGRRIQVAFHQRTEIGEVIGIDDDGTILMRDEEGAVRRVSAGDITIMKG
jgi:BirA family transcriptional regulator, biotin operon repressor / biotin---[acetyl-CoA-carboxylase] ligase